jgi:2-oxo-4-hydroxy-4-carboxy--5-ureidoimidazoline (OHCU) decarboxylase
MIRVLRTPALEMLQSMAAKVRTADSAMQQVVRRFPRLAWRAVPRSHRRTRAARATPCVLRCGVHAIVFQRVTSFAIRSADASTESVVPSLAIAISGTSSNVLHVTHRVRVTSNATEVAACAMARVQAIASRARQDHPAWTMATVATAVALRPHSTGLERVSPG